MCGFHVCWNAAMQKFYLKLSLSDMLMNRCTHIFPLQPLLPHIQLQCAVVFRIFFSINCLSFISPSPLLTSSLPSFLSPYSVARENKMFSENEIRNIIFQVLTGLVFVHKHGKQHLSHSLIVDLGVFCFFPCKKSCIAA